jgi:hypothetical protein
LDLTKTYTITDLFLCDQPAETTESAPKDRPLLPLPPALTTLIQATKETARKSVAQKLQDEERKKEEALLEAKLQDYFKNFATWPYSGVGLEETVARLKDFVEVFCEDKGLLHHCGERLKCMAFIVISSQKVALRSQPTWQEEHIIPDKVLHPGQMVIVDSVVVYDKVKFRKVQGGGWAFERKLNTRCMAYMTSVEIGLWWYRVVSREFAEVRIAPSFGVGVRSGYVLCPGEVCVVALRCMVDDRQWMCLADGRGWIFETMPTSGDDEQNGTTVIQECTEDTTQDVPPDHDHSAGHSANAAEVGLWEYEVVGHAALAIGASYSGWKLARGEKVMVDLRVPANGQKAKEVSVSQSKPTIVNRIWLRLNDGRGWVPKTTEDGTALLKFVRMASPGTGISKGRTNSKELVSPCDAWMQGIA